MFTYRCSVNGVNCGKFYVRFYLVCLIIPYDDKDEKQ